MGIDVTAEGNIPIARGLGYSSTLRAGIIAGLNELSATELSRGDIVHLVTQLEGHPDNASPAVLGGFTVSGIMNKQTRCIRFEVDPSLKAVTLVPDFQVRTSAARKLLPKEFSRADAAHALNRSALIVAAFASKKYETLRGVFDDRFHQPCRLQLIPQLDRVVSAGVDAGAIGGFLSGSGSAIICLAARNLEEVGAAMKSQLPESEVKILSPENDGLSVEKV
jgi:homoserine kinase